jgi:uncharacterized membrane protein
MTNDPVEPGVLLAILAMAGATYLTRISGFWLMSYVPLTPRLRRMLSALPGSVVVATVLPIVVRGGAPAVLAVVVCLVVMMTRRNEFLAVAAGMGAAAGARALGF